MKAERKSLFSANSKTLHITLKGLQFDISKEKYLVFSLVC